MHFDTLCTFAWTVTIGASAPTPSVVIQAIYGAPDLGNFVDHPQVLITLLPKCHDDGSDSDNSMPGLVEVETDDDDDYPEFEAQHQFAEIVIDVPLERMVVGDCVEVWWKDDKK